MVVRIVCNHKQTSKHRYLINYKRLTQLDVRHLLCITIQQSPISREIGDCLVHLLYAFIICALLVVCVLQLFLIIATVGNNWFLHLQLYASICQSVIIAKITITTTTAYHYTVTSAVRTVRCIARSRSPCPLATAGVYPALLPVRHELPVLHRH